MKYKKWLALLSAVLLLLLAAAGCGGKENKNESKPAASGDKTNGETVNTTTTTADEEEHDHIQPLTAQKIGSIDKSITTAEGGVYYRGTNGKYGIMTLDGTSDTGPIYTECEPCGSLFVVTTKTAEDIYSVTDLNCYSLVDATGKEVISAKYLDYERESDYFVKVIEATDTTTNRDEALFALSVNDGDFSIGVDDDDLLLTGNWYIFNMVTGQKIEGATGTKRYSITAYDKMIQYTTDDGVDVVVNDKGETIPADAEVFYNNCYCVTSGDTHTIYDSDRNKLFDVQDDDYVPYRSTGAYLVASKRENGAITYVLMDKTGKQVSEVFDDSISVYGNLVYVNNSLYTLDGQSVINGISGSITRDTCFGKGLMVKQGEEYVCIDWKGTVLWKGAGYTQWMGLLEKKEDGKRLYYSIADGDYTIEGDAVTGWLVRVPVGKNQYDLVDVISGKAIISGYGYYSYVAVDGAIYVYAQNGGTYDVYLVK